MSLLAAPFVALAALALLARGGPGLRALALGEETAPEPRRRGRLRLRLLVVAAAAIGTGASVAVAGSIGFVGLVAPHLVRPCVGYDPARTLVPAGLAGAALLLAADCAVRLIPTAAEVKIGVLTALLGVPFFLVDHRRGARPSWRRRPRDAPARRRDWPSGSAAATVLAGIDLAFAPARFTVVVGPNGAGKTTLLRALAGLVAPSRRAR